MPRKGYKTVTITTEKHEILKKKAKDQNRTIQEYVESLIEIPMEVPANG